MPNPTNQTNTTIPEETYELLKHIRDKQGCTFDEVLDQLCELDFQHNYVERECEYDLYYRDVVFPFKVTFKKENMVLEYITPINEKSSSISEWGLPDEVRREFYTFIKEDYARCMLENMDVGLVFKDFDIYKKR